MLLLPHQPGLVIFPTFFYSLHPAYTRNYAYVYLELVYKMAEAEYDVLALIQQVHFCPPLGVIPFPYILVTLFLRLCAFHFQVPAKKNAIFVPLPFHILLNTRFYFWIFLIVRHVWRMSHHWPELIRVPRLLLQDTLISFY